MVQCTSASRELHPTKRQGNSTCLKLAIGCLQQKAKQKVTKLFTQSTYLPETDKRSNNLYRNKTKQNICYEITLRHTQQNDLEIPKFGTK